MNARTVIPLRFASAPGRDLFALLHGGDPPPALAAGVPMAVLMLPPFGQEAVRAHRLSRVLADRIARQGVPVLRLDYFGSGDAGGDDLDADLDGWQIDVLAADRLLRRHSGCADIRWLGLRLGFTVGALAASRNGGAAPSHRPTRVVGWDPVLDGAAYLRELRDGHAEALRRSYSLPTVPQAELARLQLEAEPSEAIGFALSPRMVADLRAIDTAVWAALDPAVPLSAIRSRTQPAVPTSLALEPVDVDFDWVSEEALNTPLVPDPALRRLMQLLDIGTLPSVDTGVPPSMRSGPADRSIAADRPAADPAGVRRAGVRR